ncbi:MAG: stage III sporulation protein AF [Clostridia bacterium]|nr:stage III sporulation protein AF [Clostridia bacterium]
MNEIKGFIISLVSAAAASALIEGFVPDGGLKKYVRYLTALVILLVLVSPLGKLIGMLPSLVAAEGFSYDSVDALSRANSIVALHIEKALCEKFSVADADIEAKFDGERIIVRTVHVPWLFEEDIILYIANNFGVEAEVSFYE